MNTVEFLRAVLPESGVYLIAVQRDKSFKHKGFDTVEEAAEYALQCDAQGLPTYHACAAYRLHPYVDENDKWVARTSVNWLHAKAFWCDIDCGADKAASGKGYATQMEGAKALLAWCKEVDFPVPMLINSGRGVHAYWCLTDTLTPQEWMPVAQTLKKVMAAAGLLIDPSRTADFSSVLRPIGTHNRKDPQNPKEVKLALAQQGPIITSAFCEKVKALSGGELPAPPPWLANVEAESITSDAFPEACAELVADHCPQVGVMRESKGDVGYDHWRGVIGIIKHCKEGLPLAREWSIRREETGHASVDVDARYNTWSSGPTTCDFFGKCNSVGCEGCQYKGKIKSPIVLGRVEPEPKADEVEGVPEHSPTTQPVTYEVPELPEGYDWDGSNMRRYVRTKDGLLEPRPFCATRFYLVERIRDADGHYEFLARAHLPNRIIREFVIPGAIAGIGGSKLLELLGSYELLLGHHKDAMANMHAYLKDSVHKLVATKAAKSTHTHFGWQEDKSFLLGTKLYKPDGSVVEALLSGYASSKRDCFPGSKGTWKAYAHNINWIYNREGMEPMQYLMCAMWASPLVDLAESMYKGIPCALTGADSGKGKTTAALAALYMFGDATELNVSGAKGATAKAQTALLGAVSSLPVLFDEVTNMEAKQLSDLCYSLSNGVEGMRLQATGGAVRFSNRESWCLHPALTGNSHIAARLSLNGNTEAEAMRIFEIRVDEFDVPKLDPLAVATKLGGIEENAGAAGEVYINWLVTHRNEAQAMIAEVLNYMQVDNDLVAEPKYRFYRNHIACTIAAAKILKNLDIIKFDIENLLRFALLVVRKNFEVSRELNSPSPEDWLARMLTDFAPHIITTYTLDPLGGGTPVEVKINTELWGRSIVGSAHAKEPGYANRVFLSARAVTEWCADKRVDLGDFAKGLVDNGILLDRRHRFRLGRGTTVTSTQQRCWVLDATKFGDNNGIPV